LLANLWSSGIVEEGQVAVGQAAGIVLPGEARAAAELEVAALAAEPPEDPSCSSADLVDRVRVAGGDDEVAVPVDLDRVDVEVVVEPVGVAGQAVVGLDEANVLDAVPLEQHAARPDVELLESSLQHAPALHADLANEGHQRRVARRQLELVDVAEQAVAWFHVRDEPVAVVVDGVAALAASLVGPAVPPRQNRSAAIALHTEVRHGMRVERTEPDHAAAVVEDQRSGLLDVLLRCDEDVSRCGAACPLQDLDGRRPQVGTGVIVAKGRLVLSAARGTAAAESKQRTARHERGQTQNHATSWTGVLCVRKISSTGAATIAVAPIASAATPIASSA
jgi:hypothetical protein